MTEQERESVKNSAQPDYLHLLEQEILNHPDRVNDNLSGHSSLLKSLYRSVDLSMQQARNHEKHNHDSLAEQDADDYTAEITCFSQLHHVIKGIHTKSTQGVNMFEEWKRLFPRHYTGWWMSRLVASLAAMAVFTAIPAGIIWQVSSFFLDLTRHNFELNFLVVIITIMSLFASLIVAVPLFSRSFTWVEKKTPKIGWLNKISLFLRPNRLGIDLLEKEVGMMTEQAKVLMQPEFQKKTLAFFAQFRLDINHDNAGNYDESYRLMKQCFDSGNFKTALNHYQSMVYYLDDDNETCQSQMNQFIAQLDEDSLPESARKINIHQSADELKHML